MRPIKLNLPRQWVLPLAIIVFLTSLTLFQYQVLRYTNGLMVYPQDDGYIRMAIGKNLALHGVWGLNTHEFVPASSSILYPLILAAAYKIFGVQIVIPFIINLAAALILLVAIRQWLAKRGVSPLGQLMILLVTIFLIPLPVLVTMGMEHTLQLLFSFLFLYRCCDWLTDPAKDRHRFLPWTIYCWAFLATAIRYEGVFLIATACVFLLARRKVLGGLTLGLIGILPLLLFGIYSVQQGGYFIPNSVWLRAVPLPLNKVTVQRFIDTEMLNKLLYPYPTRGAAAAARVLIILPLLYWLFIDTMRQHRLYRYLLISCMIVTALHLMFANAILLYRYESYLLACSIPVAGTLLAGRIRVVLPQKGAAARWIAVWTGVLLLVPLLSRGWHAYDDTRTGCLNIYEQDYQVARFVRQFYNNAVVIVNDPGVAAYLTDAEKLDIVSGIGNMEVLRGKQEEYYRPSYQQFLVESKRPVIAVISEKNYNPYLYTKWSGIASMHTYNVVLMGDANISFYSVNKADAANLKKNLRDFEHTLPRGAQLTFYWEEDTVTH